MIKYIKKTKDGIPYIIENPFYIERERKIKEVLRTVAGGLLLFVVVGLIIIKVVR